MNQELKKQFKKFILPSIISSIVLGTFSIIDGLFIGNKIGDIGLAAINFAYPITAFIQSIGFGIGVAGAILMSIAQGKNESDKKYIFNTYISLLLSILILFPILYFSRINLLTLFGARDNTLLLADEYIKFIILAIIPQVLSQGLIPIIRNHSHNKTIMFGLILGFVSNLILDYLFIYKFEMSLKGAAIATNLSQLITTIFCVIVLFRKEFRTKFLFDIKIILNIFKLSLSPFGLSFSANIVLIIMNKACSIYENESVIVASYTAISYITYIVQKLIQGVGDGAQPLMSFNYGENNKYNLKKLFKYSLILSLIISIISLFITIIFRNQLGSLFGLSSEAINIFNTCSIFFALSFIGQAILRISLSYFYSINNNLYSSIIVYLEPILDLIFVLILPIFLSLNGIWLSQLLTSIILSIVSFILYRLSLKK